MCKFGIKFKKNKRPKQKMFEKFPWDNQRLYKITHKNLIFIKAVALVYLSLVIVHGTC